MIRSLTDPPALVRPADDLAVLAKQIHAALEAETVASRDSVARARDAGEHLKRAWELLAPKHQWNSWLKNQGIPNQRASERIRIYDNWNSILPEIGSKGVEPVLKYLKKMLGDDGEESESEEDGTDSSAPAPDRDWTTEETERQNAIAAGLAVVANLHGDEMLIQWAREGGIAVKIDRSSDWGNPFLLPDDGSRDQVCEAYQVYLQLKPSLLKRIKELKGKVLLCWCHPERCHGHHLAQLANETE